ncbi:hypothetical protein [Gilvibacter sp.]|uniref:hypothetical protein n=1 Tax=Gilvibacter sp. TaxID=2729997 RepID=UPI003F4A1BE6
MRILIVLLLLTVSTTTALGQFGDPYRRAKVVLKSGEQLNGEGKFKNKGYKLKENEMAKPETISYADIDYLSIIDDNLDKRVYRFYQFNGRKKYLKLELVIPGEKLELYVDQYNINSSGAGGISFGQTVTKFYLKKPEDPKPLYMGPYDPIANQLKERVLEYFQDCPSLIEKVENKDFRMRDGLYQIVEYYNEACGG